MNNPSPIVLPSRRVVAAAALRREWLSHRLNRFLYAHLVLVLASGLLPLLTPGDAFSRGAAWWLLHALLYAVSLSALLLGLSSAHAEADEFTWLLGQPRGIGPWLAGKALALLALAGGSTLLLGLPATVAGGLSRDLGLATLGAAGIAAVCAAAGLALGFWIRDSVRGLIAAVAAWFLIVFGLDLLQLATAGAPWAQNHPDIWVAGLMLNPLGAYRITVLFSVEHAAFSGLSADSLAGWWSSHAPMWLAIAVAGWTSLLGLIAWMGAGRRMD